MMVDYTEGRLFLRGKEWVLDAEPHVTTQFERLFPGSKTTHISQFGMADAEYKYTHRPRFLFDTPLARKDVLWFITRYELAVTDEDKALLQAGAQRYDDDLRKARDVFFERPELKLDLTLPLRDYQEQAVALTLHRKSLLVADQIGLGKTPVGIAIGSQHLPCVCVVPPHLLTQWEFEIHKFLPQARVHVIRAGDGYELPLADFYVIGYSLLYKLVERFTKNVHPQSLVLDEVHSLRRDGTKKYQGAASIREGVKVCVGLSATPIMNYGAELYNIYQILEPGSFGEEATFKREWCDWGKIRDPALLGNYLRKNMMMVRRTRAEVGRNLDPVERIIYTVDADLASLQAMERDAKVLALKVITGGFHEAGEAARELDVMLRKATGVAKARSVAEVVKVILESGEKVVLFAWHRDCYDIYLKELANYHPVLYTGSESPNQKLESVQQFIDGDSKVFIMSLRSGAGLNGLQTVAKYAIFGELDWSNAIIEQCIGRLWREGQESDVTAIFVTIDDGADPIMKKVIGLKATEQQRIMNPDDVQMLANTGDPDKILDLAKDLLRRQGTDVDAIVNKKEAERRGELFISPPSPDHPCHALFSKLMQATFSIREEDKLQDDVEKLLRNAGIAYEREVHLSKESRVDFRVGRMLVECKTRGFSKTGLLRQIRRYKRDYPVVEGIIVVTPDKIRHFLLDEIPVFSVNTSDHSLLISGLS